MMVLFHKRFSEENLKLINEIIAEHGKVMVIEAVTTSSNEDDSGEPGADAGNQLSLDDRVKPVDWQED